MTEYLTTRELAALLRIKERKVYDLAASGTVPCTKATGKLLFPRDQIEAWMASKQSGTRTAGDTRRAPNIIVGSHDPLLEWALTESNSGLAAYFDGSSDGLARLAAVEGCAAGLHLFDPETRGWNTPAVLGACARLPVAAVEWAKRRRGLITAPGRSRKMDGLADIAGLRFAARQPGAGAQVLFECLLGEAGQALDNIDVTVIARNEADAAIALAEGRADVCFGLEALAAQFKLGFVPVIEERFDLLVDRRAWFEPPLQALLNYTRSDAFQARATALPGYDVSGLGTVHFNGP